MKHKIPCEMICDLLPLFADHKTSEVTGGAIEEHLSECSECMQKYQRMKRPGDLEGTESHKRESDYLKKYRQSSQRKAILTVGAVLAAALFALFLYCFCIGFRTYSYSAGIIQVKDGVAVINGEMKNSNYVYKKSKIITKNGVQQLEVYACYRSIWNHDRSFTIQVKQTEIDEELKVGYEKLLADGTVISEQAVKLYRCRNPYIGDMSANGRIALTLGIVADLGEFQNALQTTTEPYGWTLEFLSTVSEEKQDSFNYSMRKYACELLALVQNVESISWKYSVDSNGKKQTHTYTVTSEQASDIMNRNIKDYYDSERMVETLLRQLDEKVSLAESLKE